MPNKESLTHLLLPFKEVQRAFIQFAPTGFPQRLEVIPNYGNLGFV